MDGDTLLGPHLLEGGHQGSTGKQLLACLLHLRCPLSKEEESEEPPNFLGNSIEVPAACKTEGKQGIGDQI